MRALMPRFLADGPAPGKARAGGRSRRGTRRDNLALTFAGRTLRRSPPGGDRGISSRPSRTAQRPGQGSSGQGPPSQGSPGQGSGASRIDRRYMDAGDADGDRRHLHFAAGRLSLFLPPGSAAGGGSGPDRHDAGADRQGWRAPSDLSVGDRGRSRSRSCRRRRLPPSRCSPIQSANGSPRRRRSAPRSSRSFTCSIGRWPRCRNCKRC